MSVIKSHLGGKVTNTLQDAIPNRVGSRHELALEGEGTAATNPIVSS